MQRLAFIMCVLGFVCAFLPDSARADNVRLVIVPFEGPSATSVQSAATDSLTAMEGIEIVSAPEMPELNVEASQEDWVAAARELQVSGFVVGRVETRRRNQVVSVTLYNGADGSVAGEASFRGRRARAVEQSVKRDLARKLKTGLERLRTQTPPAAAVTQAQDTEQAPSTAQPRPTTDTEEPETDSPSALAAPRLEVGIGMQFFSRRFDYRDDIFGALDAYKLTLGPALVLNATWYPLVGVVEGPLAGLGLTGSVQLSFALQTTIQGMDAIEYPTSSKAWTLGLRYRMLLGAHQLLFSALFGAHDYTMEDSGDNPRPAIPNAEYAYIQPSITARIALSSQFSLLPAASWLFLLSSGEIDDAQWFPNASGHGFELGVGVGFAPVRWLELQARFDWRRYFFGLDPDVGASRVAGGAGDDYFQGSIMGVLRIW